MSLRDRVVPVVENIIGYKVYNDHYNFIDTHGMDSLDLVELVMVLETEFDTYITDDEGEKLTSVNSIIQLLGTKSVT